MLRDTERVGRLLCHGRAIPVLCQHPDLTAVRLGALRHLIDDRFLGDHAAPNHRADGLRERQRRPRDSHLRFYDPDVRPVGHTLPSRSHVTRFAARGPEMQHLEGRLQGARTATRTRARPSSSLRLQVMKIRVYYTREEKK